MESVLRGFAIYFIVLIIVRISGRRTMAEMTPFDFVLILIVAETTQQGLLGDDFSLTNAALLILTLFVIDIGLSYVKEWWPAAGRFMDGRATLLMANGTPDSQAMRSTRVDLSDIIVAARSQHGIERIEQVKHAILETDGNVSIIPKES